MMKEIVLKSCRPEEYGDETVTCKLIRNADINAYLETIPEERIITATKVAPVEATPGHVGEIIHTVLLTEREGKMYILREEDTTVGERDVEGDMIPDIVITNINSTSNERYVVKSNRFLDMYTQNEDGTWTPVPEERVMYQVDEDVIIETAWGSEAVCLRGSYIVVYNAEENDFNSVEQGAKRSTYADVSPKQKVNS